MRERSMTIRHRLKLPYFYKMITIDDESTHIKAVIFQYNEINIDN